MATQYTSILKLALPTTGELSGTWGDTVNDNITSMVEEAIAGRAVINSWTANAHTLTTANGTTSESRCAMLELTDTGTQLTGAGEVICPTASKIYIVKNAANQTVTIKTSAGTGVAIANGQTKFVFCDGTNVVEAITSITTLATTTVNATTVNATTVDTTSVEVTNIKAKDGTAAGSIADSTGVVTLSSVVLTTADINGGTVDGVSIGNSVAATIINVDNLRFDGNTISSTDANGTIIIAPNGTGDVQLDADTVRVGDSNADVTITTNGTGDLILNTNGGSSSGTIRIYDGANGNIDLTPNGTGEVNISKVDIDAGAIDGVTIGGASAGAGTFTNLTTSGTVTFSGSVLSAAGRALIDDADAAAQRTTLGLGTIATQAANNVTITGGSITGITDLAVADGGTGVSTVPTNGQLLIGNGTGYSVAALTAGAGVTITNGSGSITVGVPPRAVAASGTSGTLTPNGDTTDVFNAFALDGAITLAAPSGTPVDGQKLILRLKDDGTARAITWTTSSGAYREIGITLPTTTTAGKLTYVGCVYNSTDLFWDAVALTTQA